MLACRELCQSLGDIATVVLQSFFSLHSGEAATRSPKGDAVDNDGFCRLVAFTKEPNCSLLGFGGFWRDTQNEELLVYPTTSDQRCLPNMSSAHCSCVDWPKEVRKCLVTH